MNSVLQERLRPIRERRKAWEQRLPDVRDMLKVNCEKAEQVAAKTLDEVRHAMRIDYFAD